MKSQSKSLVSGVRLLNARELDAVVGGMTHDTISDDCCKNPRVSMTCGQNGCSEPVVDCD